MQNFFKPRDKLHLIQYELGLFLSSGYESIPNITKDLAYKIIDEFNLEDCEVMPKNRENGQWALVRIRKVS
jgi:DNA-binding transcriptional regulator LsrR (DeoR family)